MKKLCVLLAVLFLAFPCVTAYGKEATNDGQTTEGPYFHVENENAADNFPLKETDATVQISGVIADVYVVQTYTNTGEQPINAEYVFPVSTRAAVHGMKMEIGDTVVTAQIKEKEEAKQTFEKAKSEGKSAALLEQQRPNVFTMKVANVMQGDIVRIEIHYTELIAQSEGAYQFVFPTVVGPRYVGASAGKSDEWTSTPYLKEGRTPPGKYNIAVNLSAGVPIADIKCGSHKINVSALGESSAEITLADPADFAGNRDFILDYKLTGKDVRNGLLLHKGETERSENFFLLMVQPPERVKAEDIPPREYIFMIDVSGSMYGYPIETSKKLMRELLTSLRASDKFNLILFSGTSFQMWDQSMPATAQNIQSAIYAIDSQDGGGGTELLRALECAVSIPIQRDYSRSIVVITDGYISAEKEAFDLIRKNNGSANFFSFGIGTGVNRYLVDGVAKAGLGESFVVTNESDALETAERFQKYIQSPVLTDIMVEYDGLDVYDVEPLGLPDLFAQKPLIMYGKWSGEPSGEIRITGKTGNGNYSQTITVSAEELTDSNPAIGYLWARSKVERLMDYGNSEPDDFTKKIVTDLGLKYSMMTPYTSFVAVIDTIRNPDKESTDVNQPLPLPRNVSDFAVGGSYLKASEPEDIFIIIPFMLVGIGIYRLTRKRQYQNGQ